MLKRKLIKLLLRLSILIITIILVSAFAGPVLYWDNLKTTPLNVWVVDKTVPIPDYREHKGLMWALNYNKIAYKKTGDFFRYDKDYFGFFPISQGKYDIRKIPDSKENPDLIYLTDTYGVYTDDYLTPNIKGTRSDLIYGGLNSDELNSITDNIGNGNTIIGEFNIASAPTNDKNRDDLANIFGLQWSGWKGRYFEDLTRDIEVPVWVVDNYEKQQKKWNYSGGGYVLISDSDQIIVLEDKKDIGKQGLKIKFGSEYASEFEVKEAVPYQYWFEFVKGDSESETIANYELDLTSQGKKVMDELGLPSTFPAIIRKVNQEYTSYYFSGDYADLKNVSGTWKYYGFDKIKRITSQFNKQTPDYFYWNCYVPMMNKIIKDVKDKKVTKVIIPQENGINFISKVEGKDFLVYSNGTWQKKFLKGVNIGTAKPGTFPGELAITKAEYLRWFKYISDMNAEVIRVYTTLKPDFYDALYLYNKTAKKPLYLMQGVWVKEEDISELNDAYADNERIKKNFIKDSEDLADIIHGNATLPEKKGFASGEYKSDISEYVIGWVLGIEWDPNFVEGTNKSNPEKNAYIGKYLCTDKASPFETFLCEVGDQVLEYEADKYKMTRALSYTNWLTTDMLSHPNEPSTNEDLAVVNVEHIKRQKSFKSGVFASYHIYPYYPEFMNYQKDYVDFKDDNGKTDTYKAYLRDLMKQHTIPVLAAEFGVPASRGLTHEDVNAGYNQGKHDELEQGKIDQKLLNDIVDEGYCGGLVFAWQDEWFKRTWNTMDFDNPDRRPYWSNPQTNEQEFGLLAFDPGKEQSICYVDGDIQEWKGEKPIFTSENVKLYAKADEKYMYLMADTYNFNFDKNKLAIPVDTILGQGNEKDKANNLKFSKLADFEILIDGKTNSKILVDSYYDSFYYMYSEQLNMIEKNPLFKVKDGGIFNQEYLCLSKEFILPQDKRKIPFSKYETGALTYGNANPKLDNYNSLSDFCMKDGKIEIRIPWQLLNVMDPSTKSIMGDLYINNGIKAEKIAGFYLGAGIIQKQGAPNRIDMGFYSWKPWSEPTYNERLKPSYYVLKDAFYRIK